MNSEKILCAVCANQLPIIPSESCFHNSITHVLYGRVKLENATSFLFFNKKNITQKLLHELKYKGRTDIGTYLGIWCAENLKSTSFMDNIDYIIPVPIHPNKMKKRGYNQVMSFCKSLSEQFSIPIKADLLIRLANTKSQTSKTRLDRSESIRNDFSLRNVEVLKNKHILLIDDVITTGATIEACCKELLKTEKLKISVLSIAFTENT